jgi:nickel-dependent lactate racemase
VVEPDDPPPLPDAVAALREVLRRPRGAPPLTELVRPRSRLVISVCDGTRAQPRQEMLAAIFDELDAGRIRVEPTILVATGTHRRNTEAELRAMLGLRAMERCEIVNHDARDERSLVDLGLVGDGVPLALNRRWVEADVRISTGFVEPHFFAGFSGGPKMVAPGLAGLGTVHVLHDARRIDDPRATWGVVEDNPVHRDIRACAAACPPHLTLDVLLDTAKRTTHAFAGELFATHRAACATALEVAMRPVPRPFDVVVTTNSGLPLDQNLYQSVKGMSAAERVVRPGGTIVVAAQCAEGVPADTSFARILAGASSLGELRDLLADPDYRPDDRWQVQVLLRILSRARVMLRCDGIPPAEVRRNHLEPVADVAEAVERALSEAGPGSSVCYLPHGSQTIPYVAA